MLVTETIAGARVKPDMRVVHPDYGDITEDVCRELAEIERQDDEQLFAEAAARQAILAADNHKGARLTRDFALKANIDGRIWDYWRRREGKDFWKHELGFMMKRHPELRLNYVPDHPTVLVDGFKAPAATTAPTRGGRWHAA